MAEGESILLYTDEGSDRQLVEALTVAARSLGMIAEELCLRQYSTLEDQIQALRERIKQGNYNVLCELSRQYFYPSGIWEESVRAGRRVYCTGPIDSDCFRRCISDINQQALMDMGQSLGELLHSADTVKITSPAGTHLVGRMQPSGMYEKALAKLPTGSLPDRAMNRLGLGQRSAIWSSTGALRRQGGSTFMGGQLSFMTIPRSLHGQAIVDGYQWPPTELGRLKKAARLKVRKGRVTEMENCPELARWIHGHQTCVEHICFGFNPGADLEGSLTEAERAYGHINLGFGKYPYHTDSVIMRPSVWLDDELILEDHHFVHPELRAIERELH